MLVVGLSLGVCMIPATYPNFYATFPVLVQNIFGSGILSGSITAITLNIFFNFKKLRVDMRIKSTKQLVKQAVEPVRIIK